MKTDKVRWRGGGRRALELAVQGLAKAVGSVIALGECSSYASSWRGQEGTMSSSSKYGSQWVAKSDCYSSTRSVGHGGSSQLRLPR